MTVAFTGYRPEKMPFIESKSDENYMAVLCRDACR